MRVVEAAFKAPGGLIRVTARLRHGQIDDVAISGDFTLLPATAIAALEQALRGMRASRAALTARITEVYTKLAVQAPGVTPDDFATAILAATGETP